MTADIFMRNIVVCKQNLIIVVNACFKSKDCLHLLYFKQQARNLSILACHYLLVGIGNK